MRTILTIGLGLLIASIGCRNQQPQQCATASCAPACQTPGYAAQGYATPTYAAPAASAPTYTTVPAPGPAYQPAPAYGSGS